jgi:hypothetical protein
MCSFTWSSLLGGHDRFQAGIPSLAEDACSKAVVASWHLLHVYDQLHSHSCLLIRLMPYSTLPRELLATSRTYRNKKSSPRVMNSG